MPKQKREETGSLSKSERQKFQRLYTHGPAAFGSARNLAKDSKLPVSKVRQFLHSEDSYTKFTLATRKFRRMRAFARYKNEIWCMDFAYVDKLAKDNREIKYLLVRQEVFDKTIDVRGLKTKDSTETLRAIAQLITKRKRPQKIWVDKGKEFAGEFKKFCDREGIQIYSTMSETKAAFAERAIRSLKNVLYRYIEDYGYKYNHKLPQFVTTLNTRRNRSIDMKPSNVKNSDFMSVLYSKPFRDFNKPKFQVGYRVQISKQDLPFRKGYKPLITNEPFKIVALATRKPPTYNIQVEQAEVIKGKFYEKELIRVI